MQIDGRQIGPGHPPYIVAEASGEHQGSLVKAVELIQIAHDAGVDAIKFQCFHPDRLAEARGGRDKVLTEGLWAGRTLGDLYRETHTPRDWFPSLFMHAEGLGITLFSSVFDEDGVDFLEGLGCPAYKVSAYEFRDEALIAKVASTRKPMIMSIPNDATSGDIAGAMVAARNLNENIAYLHCVSVYPCPVEQANLPRITDLRDRFERHGWVVGFSDHTPSIEVAIRAVKEYGASIIEKHITLSRANGGHDAAFSLEPHELSDLVKKVKDAH